METLSALLAICAGNSPVPDEFPTQRPVTRSFDVYFDLRPDKRFSKQSWGWWYEPLSHSLRHHRNDIALTYFPLGIKMHMAIILSRDWIKYPRQNLGSTSKPTTLWKDVHSLWMHITTSDFFRCWMFSWENSRNTMLQHFPLLWIFVLGCVPYVQTIRSLCLWHRAFRLMIYLNNWTSMKTSSNGNIFRVTGHLLGEFTDYLTKTRDEERWCFSYLRLNKRLSKQPRRRWFETPLRPLWRHCNDDVKTFIELLVPSEGNTPVTGYTKD